MTRPNFQGRSIPIGAGIGFVLLAMLLSLAFTLSRPDAWPFGVLVLALVSGFGALGFLDDATPSREKGGIGGHLKRLVKERTVSTALVKAGFGLCLSMVIAVAWRRNFTALADGLIIALCANAINLLDVRPGRAVKGFVFVFALVVGGSCAIQALLHRASVYHATWTLLMPFFIWALIWARYDLSCRAMLGDAGSNVLGAVLGLLCVWELSWTARLVTLVLLIGFHVLTEMVSLSNIIARSRVLSFLDRLLVRPAGAKGEKDS